MKEMGIEIFQGYPSNHEPFGVNLKERYDSGDCLRQSGIRHANSYGLQVALLALAARAALDKRSTGIDATRALLTNGGPWASETAVEFLKIARDRGSQFVNPLVFPATLLSAGAAAVGVVVGAGSAAIAIGHDELAFFEMLRRSRQLISHRMADQVILAAASASNPTLEATLRGAGRAAPVGECSLAFRLDTGAYSAMVLEDVWIGAQMPTWSTAQVHVVAKVDSEGQIISDVGQFGERQFLSAAGAVICAAALRRYTSEILTDETIVITVTRAGLTGAARFRKR